MPSNIYGGGQSTGSVRAGVVSATVNGEAVDVAGEAVYDATRWVRKVLVGQSGVQGSSKTPKAGKISFKIRDARNLSIAAFNEMDSADIVLELASGKTVTGYGLIETSDGIEASTEDGTFKVQFEGSDVTELS